MGKVHKAREGGREEEWGKGIRQGKEVVRENTDRHRYTQTDTDRHRQTQTDRQRERHRERV